MIQIINKMGDQIFTIDHKEEFTSDDMASRKLQLKEILAGQNTKADLKGFIRTKVRNNQFKKLKKRGLRALQGKDIQQIKNCNVLSTKNGKTSIVPMGLFAMIVARQSNRMDPILDITFDQLYQEYRKHKVEKELTMETSTEDVEVIKTTMETITEAKELKSASMETVKEETEITPVKTETPEVPETPVVNKVEEETPLEEVKVEEARKPEKSAEKAKPGFFGSISNFFKYLFKLFINIFTKNKS